jgi:hypothetical protein
MPDERSAPAEDAVVRREEGRVHGLGRGYDEAVRWIRMEIWKHGSRDRDVTGQWHLVNPESKDAHCRAGPDTIIAYRRRREDLPYLLISDFSPPVFPIHKPMSTDPPRGD